MLVLEVLLDDVATTGTAALLEVVITGAAALVELVVTGAGAALDVDDAAAATELEELEAAAAVPLEELAAAALEELDAAAAAALLDEVAAAAALLEELAAAATEEELEAAAAAALEELEAAAAAALLDELAAAAALLDVDEGEAIAEELVEEPLQVVITGPSILNRAAEPEVEDKIIVSIITVPGSPAAVGGSYSVRSAVAVGGAALKIVTLVPATIGVEVVGMPAGAPLMGVVEAAGLAVGVSMRTVPGSPSEAGGI